MKTLRVAVLAAILAGLSFAQIITLPGQGTPVSLTWLYYNKMRWAGAWSSTTTYNPQDVVSYGGANYVSLSGANRNNTPAPGGTVYWTQVFSGSFPGGGSQLQFLRIQPNTGSTTNYQWAAPAITSVADYAFPAQTPGGTLIQYGVNQAIALSPCPLGVAGTDTAHQVYLSGGTGTAEPVPITGGTCTSGAASGTITVTPQYAHSGAWTIGPANGGVQEEINVGGVGSLIYIPAGTYTIYGTVSVPSSVEIRGAGASTVLVPGSSTTTMFQGVAGATGISFRALAFDLHTTPVNSVVGISLLQNFHTTLDALQFNDIGTAIFIDRCFVAQASNIKLIDNTTMFVGSTLAGTGPYSYGNYSFNVQVANVQHFTSIGLGSLTFQRAAVVTFQRAINSSLVDFTTQGLMNAADGVDILSDCQGVQVIGGSIVGATNGVNMQGGVVGGVNGNPSYSTISGVMVDQYYTFGVDFGGSSFMNELIGTTISSAKTTAQSAVLISGSSRGNSVVHSRLSIIPYGYGIIVQNTAFDAHIADNYLEVTSASAGILIQGPTNPNVQVTGNRFSYLNTALPIINSSTSPNVIVRDNAGIDDVVGVDIVSSSSITPVNPIQRVSGTATITTVVRSSLGAGGVFTGPVTLLPTGAWSLATGGNIAAACTATVGKAITLVWNTTTSLWYPGGC